MIDDPDLCIVHTRAGQRIGPELAAVLDPVDPATLHEYVLPANRPVELHRHDYDEYWWFTSGSPIVTLWTEAAGARQYRLGPGDLVACPRGVAHTLRADHPLVYHQFSSVRRPGARPGHLPVAAEGPGRAFRGDAARPRALRSSREGVAPWRSRPGPGARRRRSRSDGPACGCSTPTSTMSCPASAS